jgi:hypothetical protein
VKPDDDYYYRAKPAERIALRQSLSPEARGYASTYEDQMHLRGAAAARRADARRHGMAQDGDGRALGPTIARAVKELLDKGWLMRLQDGRWSMPRSSASGRIGRRRRSAAGQVDGGGQGAAGERRDGPAARGRACSR